MQQETDQVHVEGLVVKMLEVPNSPLKASG